MPSRLVSVMLFLVLALPPVIAVPLAKVAPSSLPQSSPLIVLDDTETKPAGVQGSLAAEDDQQIEQQAATSARPRTTTSVGAVQVAAAGSHTCALTAAGGVMCWGRNNLGQLGDGTEVDSPVPVNVIGLASGVLSIATDGSRTCAVMELSQGGAVRCWGNGIRSPADVDGLAGVRAIALGFGHSCVLTQGGGVKCWGANDYGQLGNDTWEYSEVPADVSGLASGVVQLTAEYNHTCVVTASGAAKCWGRNTQGQLGDGTTTNRRVPVDVIGLGSGVTAVEAGSAHTCALTRAGGLKCWGENDHGRLGDGSPTDRSTPVDVVGLTGGVTSFSAGGQHTCAISSGAVKCWGLNRQGQIGDGQPSYSTATYEPVEVVGMASGAKTVAAGSLHTCAAISDGGMKCWGDNEYGQLGNGTTIDRTVPVDVTGMRDASAVATGGGHSCAVAGGGVQCWGASGQLGAGQIPPGRWLPVDVSGLTSDIAHVYAGMYHSCALTGGGGVQCWGENYFGQLGNGTTNDRYEPVAVSGLATGVKSLALGASHSCALMDSDHGGGVRCWGRNHYGQLGTGTSANSLTPVEVPGLGGAMELAAGWDHTCAVAANGGVKCWGANLSGQLGDGTRTSHVTPTSVLGLSSGGRALAAAYSHTCALMEGGGVKCWGANSAGQLGDGTTTLDQLAPVDVVGLGGDVRAISAGGSHTCAAIANGGAKCWGSNNAGQLGDGTKTNRPEPVVVTGLTESVKELSAGSSHTCAVTGSEVAKCWGSNSSGQLGVNPGWTPVEVVGFDSGFVISGRVTDASGQGVAGVRVSAGGAGFAMSDANGNYAINRVAAGTYAVVPSKPCYAFTPSSLMANVPPDAAGHDFAGVLPGGRLPDTGFRPHPDGYQFVNWGLLPPPVDDFTVADMIQMFGRDCICWTREGTCAPRPQVTAWQFRALKIMTLGGRCAGMSVASLRFLAGLDQHPGSPETFNLTQRSSIHHRLWDGSIVKDTASGHISYHQALILTNPLEVLATSAMNATPGQVLGDLCSLMTGSPVNSPYLAFAQTRVGPGHAVVPYAIVETSPGRYRVHVYDSNYPGELGRYVEIDTEGETWNYAFKSDETWGGDAGSSTLYAMSIAAHDSNPGCPFAVSARAAAGETLGQVWLEGAGHLLITDAAGNRIGFDGDQYVQEMSGAFSFVAPGGLGRKLEPIYFVPLRSEHSILVASQTLTETQPISVARFGPGHAVLVENIALVEGESDLLTLSPDGSRFSYRAGAARQPDLALAYDTAAASLRFDIEGADIDADQTVEIFIDTQSERLGLSHEFAGAGNFNVSLLAVSAERETAFSHSALGIAARDTYYFDYGAWDGSGPLTLLIDHESDGIIDATAAIENDFQQLYLPLVLR